MKHMDVVKAIIKQKIAKTRRENLCIVAFSYEKKPFSGIVRTKMLGPDPHPSPTQEYQMDRT